MSASIPRPFLMLAILVTFAGLALATASLASAEAPDRWNNEGCHNIDSGRVLCWEERGLIQDNGSASGQWTYHYSSDTFWTVYAADGSVEHTERTKVHVLQKGEGGETARHHESFHYRYGDDGGSCQVTYQFIVSNGETQVDHGVDNCSIS